MDILCERERCIRKNWKAARRRIQCSTTHCSRTDHITSRKKFARTHNIFIKDSIIFMPCLVIILMCYFELPASAARINEKNFQNELSNVLASEPQSDRWRRRIRAMGAENIINQNRINERVKRSDEDASDSSIGIGYPNPEEIREDWLYQDNYTNKAYGDYDMDILNDTNGDGELNMIIKKLYSGPVCALVDVRNSPDNLSDLENCTVVNGFVQIIFMHNSKESDFEKYTFPKLRVITEYLLVYRVYGLRSLRKMFPNLAVIGGRRMFYKYGMVIYENPQLQELGLGSLQHIARGGVRIQKNNKLCYLDTVDWKRLGMLGTEVVNKDMATPVIKDNTVSGEETCLNQCGEENDCYSADSQGQERQHCWGHKVCQKPFCPADCPNACMNGKCICHEQCLAGCLSPNNASSCLACLHKSHNGVCVPDCPPNTFLENNWRCVTREWCLDMTWVPHEGKCIYQCPPDHIEVGDEIQGYYCKFCGKHCGHNCKDPEYSLTDLTSIKSIYGCTKIPGRLELKIVGGDDLLKLLEEVLLGIEEVGSLVIQKTEILVSLDFFRNLKRITGASHALKDDTYSLYVLDNQNLRELFPTRNTTSKSNSTVTQPLSIDGGKAFFHFNPRLCVREIEKVSDLTAEVEDDKDISETTNGDRATCDMIPLNIIDIEHMPYMGVAAFATARVKWEKVAISDPRTLIGYQVFYRESKYKNATRFEGLYACGKSSWLIKDKLVNPQDFHFNITDAVLHNLKPFTQYALYVRTYMTSTAQKGAQSEIIYFMTEPSKPSEPVDLIATALNTSAIFVEWKPPTYPNGNLTHYFVRWRRQKEDMELILSVDMCLSGKSSYPTKTSSSIDKPVVVPTQATSSASGKECSCESKKTLSSHEEEANNNLNFENFLFKSIFQVRYINMDYDDIYGGERKKRSFYDDTMYRERRNVVNSDTNSTAANETGNNEFYTIPEATATIPSNAEIEYTWNFETVSDTKITLNDLHHFSEYEIQVFACNHASNMYGGGGFLNEHGCSIESITAQRSQRKASADVIPKNSFKLVEHETKEHTQQMFQWEAPPDPNGYIKFYTIEFQRKSEETFVSDSEECFSLDKFILNKGRFAIPNSLTAGTYRARVMAASLAGKGEWTDFLEFEVIDTVGIGPKKSEQNIWIAAVVVAFLIVFFTLMSVCYYRRKKKAEARNAMIYSSANPEYVSLAANYIPDGYEVKESDVELVKLIGHGNFGKVFVGFAKKVIKGEDRTQVAIKKLREKSAIPKRIEFLEEAKLMKAFNATHVVRLLGVVSQTQDPMVIMEYMERGDLKSHLRSRREEVEHDTENWSPPPSLSEKLEMAAEIADGMAYLAEIKYVHRDLAARNCLVSAEGVVKIGDFGLTRDVYETDYYRKDSRGLLPIRWMAPESLRDGVFDSQSDVWSYGVVLWEIATLAEQPYQGLQHDQVTRYVIDGGYMEKPKACPKKLYDLMLNCWEFNPEMRPKFTEILTSLSNDVTERFKEESYFYEQKRIKKSEMPKFKELTDEEISLLNGEAIFTREGSFRIVTPSNLTPSRSRSETPCGCHTPVSRHSNGSSKIGSEFLPHCEHLKKIENSAFNVYAPNGMAGGLAHSTSLKSNIPRRGSGILRKSESFNLRGVRNPSPHPKKTPPSTLTRRGDDLYYSLSTSGIEADIGSDVTENGGPSQGLTKSMNNHTSKNTNTEPQKDISYAMLSALPGSSQSSHIPANEKLDSNKKSATDAPYAHMNGFTKRHNSQTGRPNHLIRSSSRKDHHREPRVDDESSYVESSPQHNSKYSENQPLINHFHPLLNAPPPPPPTAPPPFPPLQRPLLQS
ncbi:insulin-like growth factor 1 receptor isoform X2 [Styela clava]